MHVDCDREREAHDLLEQAAHLAPDSGERALYKRLAAREEAVLKELAAEQDRLEAEEFVLKAIAPAPSNASVIYAGTSDGQVWRTLNGGAANADWVNLSAAPLPPA